MTAWDKGASGLFEPGAGETYWQPQPTGGYVTLTMTPEHFNHDAAAAGFQVIPPGGRIPLQAHKAAEKLWYVQEGQGEITIDGQVRRLRPGSVVAMARKVPHTLVNDGDQDLTLYFWVTPPGYEGLLADWGRPREPGTDAPAPFAPMTDGGKRSPLLTGQAAARAGEGADKGAWMVIEPEEGRSYWQAAPAGGYIQYKVWHEVFTSNRFFAGVQVLPPGGQIPPHAHTRNEEILLVRTGHGRVYVDGTWHDVRPGSVAFVSRWVTHSFRNESDEPMEIFAIFTPPGLEAILPLASIQRVGDEPCPEFTLPEGLGDMLVGGPILLPYQADQHNAEALVAPAP